MDSPAKSDLRQGLKASQKHIEFQLQREKAYTRELEDKIKSQQAHIAKLDQDKAELRRDLITLTDDEKKRTKLEEKCHVLQKELSEKQAALTAEQRRVTSAECEKEQIRRDAHASIAKWCEAEKQWIAENESLQRELDDLKKAIEKYREECETLEGNHGEVLKQLQSEKEHSSRLESLSAMTEKKMSSLYSRIESLQNDIYVRDETIFKLDEAGSKWQEICHSKDTEIKSLEIQNRKHVDTIEQLQNTISTLNQRIEATKLLGIEERGRSEKILCDFRESEKSNKLLHLELEALRRDLDHASQNTSKHQEMITDMRTKLTTLTEQLKEKSSEIRKQELTISQLTVDVKQAERERTDSSYLVSSLENQLQTVRNAFEEAESTIRNLREEKALIEVELQQVKMSHEARDEAVVLMKSDLEDKIESLLVDIKDLQSEVTARQQVINQITNQLGDANMKNEELHEKVLHDSELLTQFQGAFEKLHKERRKNSLEQFFNQEIVLRFELEKQYFEEMFNILLHNMGGTNVLLARCFGELCRLEDALQELDEEKSDTVNKFSLMKTDLENELQGFRERETKHTHEIERKNMEAASFQEKIREYEENLTILKNEIEVENRRYEELQTTEKDLSNKLINTEHFLQQMSIDSKKQIYLSQCIARSFDDSLESLLSYFEHYVAWISQKANIAITEFHSVQVKETERVLDFLNNSKRIQKETEERCVDLQARLNAADYHLGEREKSLTKTCEDFLSKIRLLETQRDAAENMKDNLLRKLDSAANQHLTECKTKDKRIQELLLKLDSEKCNTQAIQTKLQKVRKNFDYEVGRKQEYKKALEEVKSKREEAERYRATEKDWAMKAINRANEEVNYWVKSFEKLKSMLDELSSRSGARVSAVDQATINKFEEAKNRLALRDQEVNIVSSEEERSRGKRTRLE